MMQNAALRRAAVWSVCSAWGGRPCLV